MQDVPAQNSKANYANQEYTLGVTETANILKISPTSLRRLESEGKITSKRDKNNRRSYNEAEVCNIKALLEKETEEKKLKKLEKKEIANTNAISNRDSSEKKTLSNDRMTRETPASHRLTNVIESHKATSRNNTNTLFPRFASIGFLTASFLLMAFSMTMLLPYPAKKAVISKISPTLEKTGEKIADALHIKITETDPFSQPTEKQMMAAVLGVRSRNPQYQVEFNVPTVAFKSLTADDTFTVNGAATFNAGLTATNITFTSPGGINNLLTIDETTKNTLENTLELFGDATGTLSNITVNSIGGLSLGTIEGDDGNLLYTDGGEIVSGSLSDLDTTEITELGTIETGTWEADVIGVSYGGTGLTSYSTGDLIYASAGNTPANLAIGPNNYVLTVSGGIPTWVNSIGTRTYTSGEYVTSGQTLTDSISTLDQTIYQIISGESGLWIRNGTAANIYPSNNELFVITDTGRVGIGTSSPGNYALDVTGNINITGQATIQEILITQNGISNSFGGIMETGPITGATGLTSSGAITFSSLSEGIVHTTTGGVLSATNINLGTSAYLTGTLPISRGGTGISTLTQGDLLMASAEDTLSSLGAGGENQVLVISAGLPTWASLTGGESGFCTNCLVNDPGSTQTITPTNASATGLVIRQANGGTTDIFSVKNYAGTIDYFKIDNTGNVVIGQSATSGIFTVSPIGTDPIAISPVLSASSNTGTITSNELTLDRTWTFPNSTGEICLATGNCSGVGTNLGGTGTANYIAKWGGEYEIQNSTIYDNGNIGIGTTNPIYKLDLVGTANITGAVTLGNTLNLTGAATLADSLSVTGGTNLFSTLEVSGATTLSSTLGVTSHITAGGNLRVNGEGVSWVLGNVGIGTTAPGAKLEVTGNGIFGASTDTTTQDEIIRLRIGSSGGATGYINFQRFGASYASYLMGNLGSAGFGFKRAGDSVPFITFTNNATPDSLIPITFYNAQLVIKNFTAGETSSNISIYNNRTTTGSDSSINFGGVNSSGTQYLQSRIRGVRVTNYSGTSVEGEIAFDVKNGTDTFNEAVRITKLGYLGIGTTSPQARLHVAGSTILGATSADTLTLNARLASGSSLIPAVDLGSDLGAADYRFNNIYVANINSNSELTSSGQAIFTYSPADTTWEESTVRINPTTAPSGSWLLGMGVGGNQVAGVKNDGGAYFAGNVGIGTTSPTAKLNIRFDFQGPASTLRLDNFIDNANRSQSMIQFGGWRGDARTSVVHAQISGGRSDNAPFGGAYGDLRFSTYNASGGGLKERMQIHATGNIGIGTTNPSSLLHTVASGAQTSSYVGNLLTNAATSSTASIIKTGLSIESTGTWNGASAVNRGLYVNATGGATNYAAIFEGGNVGIGTTAPTYTLHTLGDGYFSTNLGVGSTASINTLSLSGTLLDSNGEAGSSGQILSSTGAATDWIDASSGSIDGSGTAGYLPLWSASDTLTDASIYESSNSLGLGGTAPNTDPVFYILSTGYAGMAYSGNNYFSLGNTTNNSNKFNQIIATQYAYTTESEGFLALGTSSTMDNNSIYFGGGSSARNATNEILFFTAANENTRTGTERMRIESDGKIGIGTTNPTQALHVIGNALFSAVDSGTRANELGLTSDGILTTATSDISMKTNTQSLESDTLSKLMQTNPITFNWIDDPEGKRDIGFIAQEMVEIFPEVTFVNPTDGKMGINYARLTPILAKAIQQQQELITNLTGFADAWNLKNIDGALVVESDMNVLGDTTLSNVTITGDLRAGMLEINSLENSLNIVGPACYNKEEDSYNEEICEIQTLHVQSNLAGRVNFFDGEIVLNPSGDVEISGDLILAGKIKAGESMRGSIEILGKEGEEGKVGTIELESVRVEKEWDEVPSSLVASPSFEAIVWISDIDEEGFTINVKNGVLNEVEETTEEDLAQYGGEIFWVAVW